MQEHEIPRCEVSRSAGYDPTGEFAVECGAEGEYCDICEMIVCEYCHRHIASHDHVAASEKKNPASVNVDESRRKTA
jgi:hypothetical protein